MRTLTLRTVFERETILRLLEEPESQHNLARSVVGSSDTKSDHYFAVFVFTVESQEDGHLLLRIASTTVVGIQRYTTTRLHRQGTYITSNLSKDGLITETLRAHYRAYQLDTQERMESVAVESRFTGPNTIPMEQETCPVHQSF